MVCKFSIEKQVVSLILKYSNFYTYPILLFSNNVLSSTYNVTIDLNRNLNGNTAIIKQGMVVIGSYYWTCVFIPTNSIFKTIKR